MKQTKVKYYLWAIGFTSMLFMFSCSKKVIHQHKEWEEYFESNELEGSVLWHNYYEGTFDVFDFPEVRKQVLPAETFHIVLGLAGIETGVIRDTSMLIPDSMATPQTENVPMNVAFRENNRDYFRWVAEEIGKKRMQYWLDSTFYGNKKMGSELTNFWYNNSLNISPDEQVGLLEKLYQGKLAYQRRTKQLVKELMRQKVEHRDTLYYQFGAERYSEKTIGWLVGWLQRKDDPYFFAIRTESEPDKARLEDRHINLLYRILRDKGYADESGILQ